MNKPGNLVNKFYIVKADLRISVFWVICQQNRSSVNSFRFSSFVPFSSADVIKNCAYLINKLDELFMKNAQVLPTTFGQFQIFKIERDTYFPLYMTEF